MWVVQIIRGTLYHSQFNKKSSTVRLEGSNRSQCRGESTKKGTPSATGESRAIPWFDAMNTGGIFTALCPSSGVFREVLRPDPDRFWTTWVDSYQDHGIDSMGALSDSYVL